MDKNSHFKNEKINKQILKRISGYGKGRGEEGIDGGDDKTGKGK